MRQTVVEANRVSQAATASISSIGLFALLLACVGLAGVTAQTAEQRRKEIGIRLALGARRRQLLRLVMGEGAIMATIGSAAGLAAAFGVLRLLAALFAPMARIIEWTLASPTLMLSVAALLIVLAVAACYLPARRFAAIDPSLALREE
ncbi:MAG TPA: FtsX-like permease family protein [Bryobacteraceae bacterium]|nr:FtsX-like permease family protein [Bryobacteraceae bacterium]